MDGEAVTNIALLAAQAETKEFNGIPYTKSPYYPMGVVHEDVVSFTSLNSFCEFIAKNPQNLDLTGAIITVNSNFTVSLLSKPNPLDGKRTVYANAQRHGFQSFNFNQAYDPEDFIVALKSFFVREGTDWDDVFTLVKKVRIEDGVEMNDDGISMNVTIKKGVSSASLDRVTKQTDHILRPYRIFPECIQPESIFFLRIIPCGDKSFRVGLYETDGGKWKLDASKNIREYILSELDANGIQTAIPVYC